MTREDFYSFSKLMDLLTEAIPNSKPLSEDAKALYFDNLGEYPLEVIRGAINKHLRSEAGRFFPKIYDLVSQIEGTSEAKGEIAWNYFLRAIDKHAYYDSVIFPTPAFHYAIERLGGWKDVSQTYAELTDKELEFKKKGFIALYSQGEKVSSWKSEQGKIQVKGHLPGFFEIDNSFRNYGLEHIKVIRLKDGKKATLPQVLEAEKNYAISSGNKKLDSLTAVIVQK